MHYLVSLIKEQQQLRLCLLRVRHIDMHHLCLLKEQQPASAFFEYGILTCVTSSASSRSSSLSYVSAFFE